MENEELEKTIDSTNIESSDIPKESDNIIISQVQEIISDSDVSSTYSLGSSKSERRKIFTSIFIVLIAIFSSFWIIRYYYMASSDIQSDASAIAAELNKKVSAIESKISTNVREDENTIKFTLNDVEYILNIDFLDNQALVGNQYHISYDMKLFVNGALLRNSKYKFDGVIDAYYYELLDHYDELSIENRNMKNTYVYEGHVITTDAGKEYYALMIKSSFEDSPKAYLLVIDNLGELAYYSGVNGKYYYSRIYTDDNMFGNGYVLFGSDSVSFINSSKKEIKVIFDMGTPYQSETGQKGFIRRK